MLLWLCFCCCFVLFLICFYYLEMYLEIFMDEMIRCLGEVGVEGKGDGLRVDSYRGTGIASSLGRFFFFMLFLV